MQNLSFLVLKQERQIMHLAYIMNTFQQEEDNVKFNTEFLHREVGDLKSRQNKITKDLQLR